jgi:hypothetical protein
MPHDQPPTPRAASRDPSASGSPPPPPITGASAGQPMGNAQIDPETSIQEAIRLKAYERWITRGGPSDSAQDDWAHAEKEVREKLWSPGNSD